MRRGGLNFLNRRNQSLFDTDVEIKDFENVEVVYDSDVIPDPGAAQVRSRPTVKHFSTFGDGTGFAVPTPKVPVLPPFNGAQIRKAGSTDRLSLMSIDDADEGQIMIPPPPSIAPPPPPPKFIPPSPGQTSRKSALFSDRDPPVEYKPASVAAPEAPNSLALKRTALVPPKPPGAQTVEDIPACPKFTPPLPPSEKSPNLISKKMPPLKPTRYSSIPNFDLLPSGASTPTGPTSSSSFNPQNIAKLYTVPKSTILTAQANTEQSPQVLYLEDSGGNQVGVHVNGKALPLVKETGPRQTPQPPNKPARRNSSGIQLEKDLQHLKQETLPRLDNGAPSIVEPPLEVQRKIPPSLKPPGELSAQNLIQPEPKQSYSPLLNRKLRNLKNSESSSVKEPAASPLQLLMAAKERDRQRAGISRQNSTSSLCSLDSLGVNVQNSKTRPNSFPITSPTMTSESLSPTYKETKPENPKITYTKHKPSVPPTHCPSGIMGKNVVKQPMASSITSPISPKGVHNEIYGTSFSFIPPPAEFANSDPEDETPPSTLPPDPPAKWIGIMPPLISTPIVNSPANTRVSSISTPTFAPSTQFKPVLQALPTSPPQIQPPPPPKTQPPFPPQIQPPSPPKTQPPSPPQIQPPSPPKTQPPSPPKTQPPSPPKTQPPSPPKTQPPSPPQIQPPSPPNSQLHAPTPSLLKAQVQTPPPTPPKIQSQTSPPQQVPPSVAESQATLLSILQKKMLEMDPKFTHAPKVDSGWDDWSSSVSDEDGGANQQLNFTPQPKSSVQPTSLDMKELEKKVTMKAQSSKKPATSTAGGGASARQQFGMTFMVRPGSKQPITPVPKT